MTSSKLYETIPGEKADPRKIVLAESTAADLKRYLRYLSQSKKIMITPDELVSHFVSTVIADDPDFGRPAAPKKSAQAPKPTPPPSPSSAKPKSEKS